MNNPAKKNRYTAPEKFKQKTLDLIFNEIDKFPESPVVETVSEFAESDRVMISGITNFPGQFSFKRTPYFREPANNMSDMSPIQETYIIKPTQVGYTAAVLENAIGYFIKHGIGPMLFATADQAMAEAQMELRVDDMVNQSNLSDKIKINVVKKNGKGTGDRKDIKQYGGTYLRAVGANSESKLSSFSAKIVLIDEFDKFPLQTSSLGLKADPYELIKRRADGFEKLRKILGGSTPKDALSSRVEPEYYAGDMRLYNIKCPGCGNHNPWEFKNLIWDKDENGKLKITIDIINGVESPKSNIYFECPDCSYQMREKEKPQLIQEEGHGGTAKWIPTKIADRPFMRSYKITAFYGFRSWRAIIQEWDSVQDDPNKLRDFISNVLAETWNETQEKPVDHEIYQLSQQYELWNIGEIPNDVLFLTASVDVQGGKDSRLEFMLTGHGRNKQVYVVDYKVFKGNTAEIENQCWKNTAEQLTKAYKRKDGQELFIKVAFIDSQFETQTVETFCEQFPVDHLNFTGVYPLKSQEKQDKLVKFSKSNIETPAVSIDDQAFKRLLYSNLKKRPLSTYNFPNSYIHCSHEYGEEFYKQLTSEEIEPIKIRGVIKGYLILNKKKRRNEVLDLLKYNLAAFQFSLNYWFELLNENIKLEKGKQIQQDTELFFDYVEESLYG